MSFNGGTFTITGNNLSPSSYITVNGLRGTIATHSASSVIYNVPKIVTTDTQSTFTLTEVKLLDNGLLTKISDMNSADVNIAFDGSIETYYGSTNPECWLGVDAGAGVAISVDRFKFFPNLAWKNIA